MSFEAACFKPELFGNVYIGSPSFANIRNGIVWLSVIRISERKPIKVFQTVGKHDLDNIFGSWRCGGFDVANALRYAGYDHLFYLTEAGHSIPAYLSTLPKALEWLFGGPEPVLPHMEKQTFDDEIK